MLQCWLKGQGKWDNFFFSVTANLNLGLCLQNGFSSHLSVAWETVHALDKGTSCWLGSGRCGLPPCLGSPRRNLGLPAQGTAVTDSELIMNFSGLWGRCKHILMSSTPISTQPRRMSPSEEMRGHSYALGEGAAGLRMSGGLGRVPRSQNSLVPGSELWSLKQYTSPGWQPKQSAL